MAKVGGATPKVHVVLDTNALFTELADKLIAAEISQLILAESKPLGLDISWHLPALVRAERRRQMLERGTGLLSPLSKLENLLGHRLGLSSDNLAIHVDAAIDRQIAEHGLKELHIDYGDVDWGGLIDAAVQKKPPFSPNSEKGFKDAVILESFCQLVAALPKTAKNCRIILLTSDELLAAAATERVQARANASVARDISELRTLLNAITAHLDQETIQSVIAKAKGMFFVEGERDGLYYKWEIPKELDVSALTVGLEPGFSQKITGIQIAAPTFLEKTGQRIHLSTRITARTEATKVVPVQRETNDSGTPATVSIKKKSGLNALVTKSSRIDIDWTKYLEDSLLGQAYDKITQLGVHVYLVRWHVTLNSRGSLVNPTCDSVDHSSSAWEAAQPEN